MYPAFPYYTLFEQQLEICYMLEECISLIYRSGTFNRERSAKTTQSRYTEISREHDTEDSVAEVIPRKEL